MEHNLEKALAQLQASIHYSPNNAKAYYELALTYHQLNQPEKANDALQSFRKLQALEQEKLKKGKAYAAHERQAQDTGVEHQVPPTH